MTKYDKSGINLNTHKLLFASRPLKVDKSIESKDKYYKVIDAIELFTKIANNKIKLKLYSLINSRETKKFLKNVCEIEPGIFQYRLFDGSVITFSLLSNYIDSADTEGIEELLSDLRYHKCHSRSMEVGASLEDSKILTGTISFKKIKYIHSVVEYYFPNFKKLVIIDWTKNLVMAKEDYIKLMNLNCLNIVDSSDIVPDYGFIRENIPHLTDREYLLFRDELINDFNRNSFMFKDIEKVRTKR